MKRLLVMLAVGVLVLGTSTSVAAGGKVVHRVSAGGADVCEAVGEPTGCDRNYSLVATERADGSVRGQWQDTFGGPIGGLGLHIAVDCLNVDGNAAVIGGVVTHGLVLDPNSGEPVDPSGGRALTAVVDNGRSAKDPPDQISYSLPDFLFDFRACTEVELEEFELFDLTNGQVVVR